MRTEPGATPSSMCVPPASISTTRSLAPTATEALMEMFEAARALRPCVRRTSQASAKIAASTRPSDSNICRRETAVDINGLGPGSPPESARRASSFQLANALNRTDHVSQPHAEFLVDHHHLAVCDQGAVGVDVERLAGGAF